jgi:hypothetical protein
MGDKTLCALTFIRGSLACTWPFPVAYAVGSRNSRRFPHEACRQYP